MFKNLIYWSFLASFALLKACKNLSLKLIRNVTAFQMKVEGSYNFLYVSEHLAL